MDSITDLSSSSVLPSISTVFSRPFSPRTIFTLLGRTSKKSARKRHNSILALPSIAGAATLRRTVLPIRPTTSLSLALGMTRTRIIIRSSNRHASWDDFDPYLKFIQPREISRERSRALRTARTRSSVQPDLASWRTAASVGPPGEGTCRPGPPRPAGVAGGAAGALGAPGGGGARRGGPGGTPPRGGRGPSPGRAHGG